MLELKPMRIAYFLCIGFSVSAFAHGGTSSGGPPADLYFYAHCTSTGGDVAIDVAGLTGYAGLDQKALLNENPNPCASDWGTYSVHPVYVNGLMDRLEITSGDGTALALAISPLYQAGPAPHPTLGVWTPSNGSSQIAMTCDLYNGLRAAGRCPGSMASLISCSQFQVCVNR